MRCAYPFLLLLAVCLASASPACEEWRGPKTIRAANGQVLCAKHHVPLITVRAYRAPKDAEIDMIYGYIITERCYPNHIPARVSLNFAPRSFDRPVTIHYCPRCERELQREAERLEPR
jgi:hypothetical protein